MERKVTGKQEEAGIIYFGSGLELETLVEIPVHTKTLIYPCKVGTYRNSCRCVYIQGFIHFLALLAERTT